MPKYTIGIDFGSLSGRAVLVDAESGREVASATCAYPHAILTSALPDGTTLKPDWALQVPQDFLHVLDETLPALTRQVDAQDIVGIGLDCTSSSAFPVYSDGTPLCAGEPFCHAPHAYVMMWKHHGCQAQALRMTQAAEAMQADWLALYGGKVSPEWFFPKLLQVLEEAPDVYAAMDQYVEVADWVVWMLTGRQTRSRSCIGYKAFYAGACPGTAYFRALNPTFEHVVEEKVRGPVVELGQCAGRLTPEMAARYGLCAGIPVAAASIDAHACVPAAGIDQPGPMMLIIGTSCCHLTVHDRMLPVPGISGVVRGGILPGMLGYESGQSCVGDMFHWFEANCVPGDVQSAARAQGKPVQTYLTGLAQALKPGESGLLALDWWNGNRCILSDAELTGLILGMTLETRPEEIYRALLEAMAYGTRVIADNYRRHGVPITSIYASGGISQKNALLMQILADVLCMPVQVVDAAQGAALGSAIFAAAAAGVYPDVPSAIRAMGSRCERVYLPIPAHVPVYEALYQEYKQLHDYFGAGGSSVMKRLRALKAAPPRTDITQERN